MILWVCMKSTSKKSIKPADIDLPLFDKPMQAASVRSMDEIDMWIEQDYELFFDRFEYEKKKLESSVCKRFSLETI